MGTQTRQFQKNTELLTNAVAELENQKKEYEVVSFFFQERKHFQNK